MAIEVNTSTSWQLGPDVENDEQGHDSRGRVIDDSYVDSGQVGAVEPGGTAVPATAKGPFPVGNGPSRTPPDAYVRERPAY